MAAKIQKGFSRGSCRHLLLLQAKSEDQVATERQWLEAERMWLVHKGGFTSAVLQPGDATAADGNINIKLDSGEILTVDEEDVEKVGGVVSLTLSPVHAAHVPRPLCTDRGRGGCGEGGWGGLS